MKVLSYVPEVVLAAASSPVDDTTLQTSIVVVLAYLVRLAGGWLKHWLQKRTDAATPQTA